MTQHILIEKARRSPHRARPDLPEGAYYDASSGRWYLKGEDNEEPFSPAATKKNDMETGEDMKGE